ncbi:MAG TPA: DUF6603 domain-containing protein [Candidatus Acidoferrum sp.]|nr:DUF6603 domain-containing protein [Candidatus Acidoferrum sp.]
MAADDTISVLGQEIAQAFRPLEQFLSSPDSFQAFMTQLGWKMNGIPAPIQALVSPVAQVSTNLDAIIGGDESDSRFAALIQGVVNLVQAIEGLSSAAFDPSLAADNFAAVFPDQLIQHLLSQYFRGAHPTVGNFLSTIGVVRGGYTSASGNRPAFMQAQLVWSDIPLLLTNPLQVFQNAYRWGTPQFDTRALLQNLRDLFYSVGAPSPLVQLQEASAQVLEKNAPLPGSPIRWKVQMSLFDGQSAGAKVAAGVSLLPLPAVGGSLPGLAMMPYVEGAVGKKLELMPNIFFTVESDFDFQGGVGLTARPGEPFQVILGFNNPGSSTTAQGKVVFGIEQSSRDGSPVTLLGAHDGTRLQVQRLSGRGGFQIESPNPLDFFIELDLQGGQLVVSLGDADGFLTSLLPKDGLKLNFDFGIGWSKSKGVYFKGTAGLETSVPLHIDLGPVSLDTLYLKFAPGADSLVLEPSLSVKGSLGPLSASVDHIGFDAKLAFHHGNLGPVDFSLGFKPPNGIGLSLDADVIQGGGFLYLDADHGEYAGALQLVFADFLGLQAIGLITTKMPDGSSGFSLLIIVSADFGAGIQLGFGFTLLAVGGLLGLNRTMLFQPLMDGVRTDSIESIMFPKDVIANATRIISDLRAIFPPQEGTFLIGPMAKLGWGEPTLISLSLGIIIEIPPGDIAILGILKLALPAEDIAVLLLQVNFAGALEFDKKRFYFFASLFDSHILFITLEGEIGVLMAFGDDANFVVSVGGFHPQYNPPPLPFPSPRRIEVDIINESFARIRFDGYFAVTSNSVQFGAHADMFFGFSAFNVQGYAGLDALFQFSPFHFSVSISVSFSLSVFGFGVYGIGISLTLEGTTPWHACGTASLSFFFFSVDVGIDFTWGDSRNTMLPPVAVMPILSGEFGKRSNWKAVLPSGSNLLVVLRQLDAAESAMVLHPVGTLQVSQRAAPLDLTLDKDGNQQPSDANYFSLEVSGGGLAKTRTLQEQFAAAQFKNMDDAAKLSQPAFVPMDSGIELSAAGNVYGSGTAITRNVRYDLTIIDTNLRRVFRRFYVFTGSLFAHFLTGSSVTRSELSAHRKGQAQPYSQQVAMNSETFAVALQSNNKLYSSDAGGFKSQVAAQDYLSRTIARDPALTGTLHVLPQFEVAA